MSESARQIPADRYAARLSACREAIMERRFAGVLIGVGPDLRYVTGFVGEPMERITLLVVPREGPVSFVVPHLEAQKAGATPLVRGGLAEVIPFDETDDAAALVADLFAPRQLASGAAAWEPIGLSDRLWAMHVLALQAVLPGRKFEPASAVMRDLRQVKDADEARLLSLAAAAADRTVDAIASGRLVGRTEAEISREIRGRLIDEGHDLADFAIVGSGPNSASPHHDASDRVIVAGEPIVLDIGGTLAGYCSDTTRTVWVGGEAGVAPEPEFVRVFELVREARRKRRLSSGRASRPSKSTRQPARSSPRAATVSSSPIASATASALRSTRTRTWSPATPRRWRRGWPSVSSPASTSQAAGASGWRTSSCARQTAPAF